MKKPRTGYLVLRMYTSADVTCNGETFPADFEDGDTLGVCFVFGTRRAADDCAEGKYRVDKVRLKVSPK